jgi:hypothetical protein
MEEIPKTSKERRKEYADEYRKNNKHIIKKHYEENKEEILQKCKEYREQNKEKIKQFKHDYYQKEENKIKRNEKDKLRKQTDVVFKLITNVRSQVHKVLTEYKNNSTYDLLGCNKLELKAWLEYQFDETLTWENYGSYWHMDHVIPLAFFDLTNTKQQFLAFNWSNLKPLPAKENLSKNDTIVKDYIINHMHTLQTFITLNTEYQANIETCWWLRLELRYGKNKQDEEDFHSFLKLIIRNEDTNSDDLSEIIVKMKMTKIK